jgi:hypothetical protein
MDTKLSFLLSPLLLFAGTERSNAQTISTPRLSTERRRCGKDIDKYCKKTNLGGGRVQQCLGQNQASVSARCKATVTEVRDLLQKRAEARVAVLRVCDVDIRRLCAGIQPGDGNLMECFYKARRNMSAQCQQAVVDAGYE